MQNLEKLINDTLKLFPETIDISDGELSGDNGFFSRTLSNVWRSAEDKNGICGNDVDFMIWSIFRLLHRKSRENFNHGLYSVCLNEINNEDIENEYQRSIEEAK